MTDTPSNEAVTTMRECPFCTEQISVRAIKCRYCHEFLDGHTRESVTFAASKREPSGEEVVIWEGHPSGLYYMGNYIVGILLTPLLGIGLIMIVHALLDRKARVYTVSNRRVAVKWGIVSRHTNEVGVGDIRSIGLNQGMLERMFGLGTVHVASAGTQGVEVFFGGVGDPEHIQKLIRQVKDGRG